MTRQQVDGVGGLYALTPLARELGTSRKALLAYIRRHDIPVVTLGNSTLVSLEALAGYRVKLGALMTFEPAQ